MELPEKKMTFEEIEEQEFKNLKHHLKKFYILWKEFGIDEDQTIERGKAVWKHLWTLLHDIYQEENSFYKDIKERIQNYTKKINDLANILSITPREDNSLSLIKKEESLRQELDSLTKLKHKRIKSYQDLRNIESRYCSLLGMEEHQLPSFSGVPSEKELWELDQHIKMLKDERDRRYKKFCTARKELTTILEVTEFPPETSLEKDVLSGSDNVLLTNDTLKALDEVLCKAHQKKKELETQKKELLEKLQSLWNRLKVTDSEKKEFLSKHLDCKLSTINSLEEELKRCEKIKKENIKMYIDNLRQELQELWNKCYVSDAKRQFTLLQSKDMSDEILKAHETEVEKWKSYLEVVKHIINKIEKRKELWDLLLVFENKASDPNRFKNRRGNLLKEERERKKLQKDLPALEKDIFNEIELYEAVYGQPFLYFGNSYRSFVDNQWKDWSNQKENEKMERQKLRMLQNENEAVLGSTTPCKRPLLTTPRSAPSKLIKTNTGMSVYRTPTSNQSKAMPNTTCKSALNPNRLVKSVCKSGIGYKLFPSLGSRPNTVQKKDQNRVLREKNNKSKDVPESSKNATTYSQFAQELNSSSRRSCRSSVLSTRKPGGTRISQNANKSKRKSVQKSVRRSLRNVSKTTTNLAPARGKLGLPFLI